MSNNYNSTLQSNNTDLQAILNTINELPEAGGSDPVLQDKTVTPTTSQQSITADSGYDGLDTVTVNAMPTATQATPSITVNSSGLITATATQTAGYVAAGSKSATKQLAFQAAKTITPSTTSQIAVSSGYYTGGNVTVAAIPNTYVQPSGTLNVTTNGTHDVKNYASVSVSVASSGGDTSMEDSLVTRTVSSYTNDRVTSIGIYAFASCSRLTTVSFPKATSIGIYAFASCSRLTTVSFPKATSIGSYAFVYCTELTTVSFPAATSIGTSAFASCSRLTTVSFPAATSIGTNAFASCSRLTTASFPKATTIGSYAFWECSSLTTASFPSATTIGGYAFWGCSSLTTASFPSATTIGSYAFWGCSRLTTASFPNATTIGSDAFWKCSSLTTASFPKATTIGDYAFASCSSLTTASFPKATSIGSYAFERCSRLTTASFPKATSIGSYAFERCSRLTTASFPKATSIGSYAFYNCYNLKSLYLTGSSVCKLSASNAFASTPIGGYSTSAGTYGSIYVPASLLTSYKAATNWTYFSSRFVGI